MTINMQHHKIFAIVRTTIDSSNDMVNIPFIFRGKLPVAYRTLETLPFGNLPKLHVT
jgi:hypothetical protein